MAESDTAMSNARFQNGIRRRKVVSSSSMGRTRSSVATPEKWIPGEGACCFGLDVLPVGGFREAASSSHEIQPEG
jgi:hypothetical protein